jgi:hypothetical protein
MITVDNAAGGLAMNLTHEAGGIRRLRDVQHVTVLMNRADEVSQ